MIAKAPPARVMPHGARAGIKTAALDAACIVLAKAALAAWLVAIGFRQISDDDYARAVIAERFAAAPGLDPSGTSWLPAPFWITGAAMAIAGRSLTVARAVGLAAGALAPLASWGAMRAAGVARATALAATLLAMTVPWSAWTAAAPVPEGFVAPLVAAGVMAWTAPRARILGACALLFAALSRYEAWPACAVVALAAGAVALRRRDRADRAAVVVFGLCVLGPLSWMAWNLLAHGDALHFFARVSAFRQRTGAADVPLAEKVLAFPRALAGAAPHVLALAALAAPSLRDAAVRRRWLVPLAAALATVAFLVAGDVRDGAPTHHPERALVPVWWILAGFGADGARALAARFAWARPKREMFVVGAAAALLVALCALLPGALRAFPGDGPSERREAQVARGLELRARGVQHLEITPCAYEHFALLAAFGAPERAEVHEPLGVTPGPECPLSTTQP